jgi:2,3-dihydro-2,3-dihydroxybenzoate dehydrogenase
VSSRTDQLRGRLALVTGAAGGLGGALVRSLSQRGATVVACDVDTGRLGRLESGRVHPWRMDLSDPEDIQRGLQAIAAEHHFAGDDGDEPRAFVDHSPSQVLETLAVAVTGPTLLTQLVCKRMVERRSGRIVLTGSMHRTGAAGLVMYSAAKAYVNALARGLFLELREYDVVTSVANPGGMHTALHRHRHPWMLDPAVVAETIVEQLALPGGVAVLSFEMVPHHPEHPDSF